jgi:hypothetical protein
MGIPEEDLNPYRHAYGDYTHYNGNLTYRFEWTPFTPAIRAWQNAENYLKAALGDLADAQKLTGFALNGLADEHVQMMATLKVLAEDTQACHTEAGKVVKVLEVANTDYANSNEASLEEYKKLMAAIDGTRTTQGTTRRTQDTTEQGQEAQRDKDIFPFDGTR